MPYRLFLRAALFNLLCFSLWSQTASVSGLVTDGSGAGVPSAEVRIRNLDTSAQIRTRTSGEGAYAIKLLKPGRYDLLVEAAGFKLITQSGLRLEVGQSARVDFQLEIGSQSESLLVEDLAMGPTEEPSVGTTISRQFVENLPLNGRSFQSLLLLAPGVGTVKPDYSSGGQFSVNGQRANANYFTVDGVSANIGVSTSFIGQSASGSLPGLSVGGGTNSLVSVDALEEFKLLTSSFAPEYGRMPGGQVVLSTRSGGNAFHGTLFNYLRNDVLDANDWFGNRADLARPALRQNDFGGVLGGPVKRDQTFFFFSYEGLRLRQPQGGVSLVPSLEARAAAHPSLRPILQSYPLPNGRTLSDGAAEFLSSYSNPSSLNATSLRLDHNFGERFRVFGRYNYAPSESRLREADGTTANTITNSRSRTQTLTIGASQTLSSRWTNDLRANWSNSQGGGRYETDNFGGGSRLGDNAIFPAYMNSDNANFWFQLGPVAAMRQGLIGQNHLHQLNLVDNTSYVAGKHQLQFGVDFRRHWVRDGSSPYLLAYWFFNGVGSPGATNPAGTMLSGILSEIDLYERRNGGLGFNNFSAYGQDTWRVTPRLTLTYGVRWEVNPAPVGLSGKPLFGLNTLSDPALIQQGPPGSSLYRTRWTNFAPRFGASYRVSNRSGRELVLRGGWGVFYDLGYGTSGEAATSWPYGSQKFIFDRPLPLTAADLTPDPLGVGPISGMRADPDLKLPRTQQWNIALEQALGNNQTISVTYLGAVGRELLRIQRLRAPNPSFSGIRVLRNADTSDYHAFQLQWKRSLAKGFQAIASYNWAHSIDTGSSDALYDAVSFRDPSTNRLLQSVDRGSSDFDIRHSFSTALTYQIPTGRLGSGAAKALLQSWAIDGLFSARTALPVNLYAGSIVVGDGFTRGSVRPDLVPGQPLYLYSSDLPGGRRFNRAAFAIPSNVPGGPAARQGTLGRNVLRGFGMSQVDLALRREFGVTERFRLQFRAEAFNLLNTPNFGDPGAGQFPGAESITNPLFGISRRTLARSLAGYEGGVVGGFSPLYQAGGPRSLQMALKLVF